MAHHLVIPDEELRRDVQEALAWNPLTATAGLQVEVTDGIVSLHGTVSQYIQKPVAARIIGRIKGVRNLAGHVAVMVSNPPADDVLARVIKENIAWRNQLKAAPIEVEVKAGAVTLTGTVQTQNQKKMAEALLHDITGVTAIHNHLAIVPAVLPPTEQQLRYALYCCAGIEAGRLRFVLDKGHVRLMGFATSMEQKQDAEDAVWGVPGISGVENLVIVQYMNDFAY